MHEAALIQETLELAARTARSDGATRIHGITMRVGALSGAVPEALEFAFDIVSRGTIAEGAAFTIERVPILCFCSHCGCDFSPSDLICICPVCSSPASEVRQGRELQLIALEVS